MKRYLTVVLGALALMAAGARADDMTAGPLTIRDVWSRATPARTGVAYLTVFNGGTEADRLVGVESPVADRVELHTHAMKGDIMEMRRIDGVDVHPGEPAVLAPGGSHVMLIGLKAPLRAGDHFPLTLVFRKAGKVTVEAAVGKAGGMGPGAQGGHKHMHGS